MSFIIQNKDGLGQLRLDTDGPGPGERQEMRCGELGSRFVGTWTCRDLILKCQEAPFAAIAQNLGREGLHVMTASMRLVHFTAVDRYICWLAASARDRQVHAIEPLGRNPRRGTGSLEMCIRCWVLWGRSQAGYGCLQGWRTPMLA